MNHFVDSVLYSPPSVLAQQHHEVGYHPDHPVQFLHRGSAATSVLAHALAE